MLKRNIIYFLVMGFVILATFVSTFTFAYINKPSTTGNTFGTMNVLDISDSLSMSYSGQSNLSLPITLDDLRISQSSDDYTSYVSADSSVTINFSSDSSTYVQGATCGYKIKYVPSSTYVPSAGAVEKSLNELVISGTNGIERFSDVSIDNASSEVELYEATISTSGSTPTNVHNWTFTMKFYNLNVDQASALGQTPAGKIVITPGECGAGLFDNSYAIYSETDNSLIFYNNTDVVEVGSFYNDRVVTAKYDDVQTTAYTYSGSGESTVPNTPWYEYASSIKKVSVADRLLPLNTSVWFCMLTNLESINLTNLDTSRVSDMTRMFDRSGYSNVNFQLNLGDKFDTSNVTNMRTMFQSVGYSNPNFTLDLGDKYNTSKVTNMQFMFNQTAYKSQIFELDLGRSFDTSQVTDMSYMFDRIGYTSIKFTLDLQKHFNTCNVTTMKRMFGYTGYSSPIFTLNLGEKFDTSKVIDMGSMFSNTGYNSQLFTLDLGDKFDTQKVSIMSEMFNKTGYNCSAFTLSLGDKFDTSNVTNMYIMFQYTGNSNSTFTLDLGEKFNPSKASNMSGMFLNCGNNNPNFILDLSRFIVLNTCDLTYFACNSASKIIFGEGWANATLVSQMFYEESSTPIEIVNAPANILAYNFAADNRVPTFTTI